MFGDRDNVIYNLRVCRYGGGEDQHFVLSLLELEDGLQTAVASNWSQQPHALTLTGLEAARGPRLLSVHAANTRGSSDPVYLTSDLAAAAVAEVSDLAEAAGSRQSVLYILVSVLASVMLLSLLLSLSHFCRRKRLERLSGQLAADKPSIQLVSQLSQSTPLLDPQLHQLPPAVTAAREAGEQLPRRVSFCAQCEGGSRLSVQQTSVQRTVVRSYSIDKLRPQGSSHLYSGKMRPTEATIMCPHKYCFQ